MARAKPSSELLTVSETLVNLNKIARQSIIDFILQASPRYQVKQHEIMTLVKVRNRSKGISKYPTNEDVIKLDKAIRRIFYSLPKRLVLKGEDEPTSGIYDDQNDSVLAQNFFNKLENAMVGYVADKKLDSVRPTQKEVKAFFSRLGRDCERVEKRLLAVDDASRAFAANHNIDIDDYTKLIGNLRELEHHSAALTISRKSQARFTLVVLVARALNSIGVAVTTTRAGLLESLLIMLIKSTTQEDISDLQDIIRAALASGEVYS